MTTVKLGSKGPEVFPIGLGCMSLGLADVYTSGLKGEEDAVALVRRALDLGVTMLDTANIYGDSEIKVGRALIGRRSEAVLATKFGVVTEGFSNEAADGSPAYLRRCLDESLAGSTSTTSISTTSTASTRTRRSKRPSAR